MGASSNRGHSNTPVVRTDSISTQRASLRILIDWLGFTFNSDDISVYHVLDFFEGYLGIDRKAFKPGRKNYEGYASSLVFENINIYYEGSSNQGIHVDLTGQACRFLDYYFQKLRVQDQNSLLKDRMWRVHNWNDLLMLLFEDERIKFTRLDIACDDMSGYIDIMHVFQKCLAGEMTMKFRSWTPYGKFDSDGKSNGLTLYFGSDQSDIQCTFYEKNKQLNLDYHWTRIELRFYKKRALEMIKKILFTNHDIGIHFAGVLKNYLTFRIKNDKDSNKRRWKVAPWWDTFLAGVPRLQIASALPDRSIMRSKKWVSDQVSRTIARLFFAYQDIDDNWMSKILQEGVMKLDQEDLHMIEEFRRLYGKDANKFLEKDFAFDMKKESSGNEDSQTE